MTTISRAIPQTTDDGTVEIPISAWADVRKVAEEEFNATITFHDHTEPGSYHGRDFVPFAHYLVEVTLDAEQVDDFVERIDPLIDAVIERHTQQFVLPAGI